MSWISALSTLLEKKWNLVIFIAPPAWGKTFMLKKIIFGEKKKAVFISPLKALALEQYDELFEEHGKRVFILHHKKNGINLIEEFSKVDYGIMIMTPEILTDSFLDYLSVYSPDLFFVFDEFHLFYLWGEKFRPIMFEALMATTVRGFSLLALSATIKNSLLRKIKYDFFLSSKSQYLINLGNMKLLHRPTHEIGLKGLHKKSFHRRFFYELKKNRPRATSLYFCRYRSEVDFLVSLCLSKGYSALGCKGGEVDQFIEELDLAHPPQCIFSTSCLSHGVNLPRISRVFIDYKVTDEFLVQMLGRAGRKGEVYSAFHCNKNLNLKSLFLNLIVSIYCLLQV